MTAGAARDSGGVLSAAAIAGEAFFSGCLAVVAVPHAALQAIVPAAVTLPSDAGTCRCLLAFGRQEDAAPLLAGVTMPFRVQYHELMVAIPFARRRGDDRSWLFVVGMACDAWWAVWNGNLHYGFAKQLAAISWSGGRFLMTDRRGGDLFAASLLPSGVADPTALEWIQRSVALPVLGIREDGLAMHSRFEWDMSRGQTPPVAVSIAGRSDLRELPAGLDLSAANAYAVHRMRWRLSWPVPAGV